METYNVVPGEWYNPSLWGGERGGKGGGGWKGYRHGLTVIG